MNRAETRNLMGRLGRDAERIAAHFELSYRPPCSASPAKPKTCLPRRSIVGSWPPMWLRNTPNSCPSFA